MRNTYKNIMMILLLLPVILVCACVNKTSDGIRYIAPEASRTARMLEVIPIVKVTPAPTAVMSPSPFIVVTATPRPTGTPRPTPRPTTQAEHRLAGMTVEEKIGQLVMFGFTGTESVSSEFKALMRQYCIGNVILYGPNIDRERSDGGFLRCKKLTDGLRAVNTGDAPLMIAIDVEGGDVVRFKWDDTLLSAASLGKKNKQGIAESQFERIGEGLLKAGIDLDLAPVMDIAVDPSGTFLKNRIISSSPEVAGEIGAACIRGLHNSGCLSLVKHFPGHGATASDSHKTTPVIKKTKQELDGYELRSFRYAADAGADGVMVGHLSFPKIDPDHIASQSYYFITEVLRGELGFKGFVMSDDFRMDGLRNQGPLGKAAVNFILAGGDIILCGPNHTYQKEIMEGLYAAYEEGTLTEERIDESALRILETKYRFE